MTVPVSPVGPVRSGLVRLGPVGLVRSVRCVYEDTRTGPIPRTNKRTEQRRSEAGAQIARNALSMPLATYLQINESGANDAA
jgi:hypothetical protein